MSESNRKKVLHVISDLDVGGAQIVVVNTVNAMHNDPRWETHIAILGQGKSIESRLITTRFLHPSLDHSRRYALRTLCRLVKLLKKVRPDVLHLHLWLPKFYGTLAGFICRVPVIVTTEHSGSPWALGRRKITDRFLSFFIVKRVMVCDYIKRQFVDRNICRESRACVIYNPLPVGSSLNSGIADRFRDDVLNFLFVGALRKVKQVDRLVNSFADYVELKNSPVSRLIIVGDGPELEKARDLAEKRKILHQVFFELSQDDVDSYLQAADVFVMTSLVEGFSVALAEAMFKGLACICTDTGGIPEMISSGETGLLLNRISSETDAEVFLKAAVSPELRKTLGSAAQKRISLMTDSDTYSRKLKAVYENRN